MGIDCIGETVHDVGQDEGEDIADAFRGKDAVVDRPYVEDGRHEGPCEIDGVLDLLVMDEGYVADGEIRAAVRGDDLRDER